jgi:hypothetical protein
LILGNCLPTLQAFYQSGRQGQFIIHQTTTGAVVDQPVPDKHPLGNVDQLPHTLEMFPSDFDVYEQTRERPGRQRKTPNYLADYVQQ